MGIAIDCGAAGIKPDMARIKGSMQRPILVDGRNLYDPEEMRALGFQYRAIGRPEPD